VRYTEPEANRVLEGHRFNGAPFVEVFRCPLGDEDHFHVTRDPDDVILAGAREAQRARSARMAGSPPRI
jgi:hypothetical protein